MRWNCMVSYNMSHCDPEIWTTIDIWFVFWFVNHLKLVAWIDVQRGLLSRGDRITTSKSQRPGLNMHGHYSKHEVCEKLQANQNG